MFVAFGVMTMAIAGMVMLKEDQCKGSDKCPALPYQVIPKEYPYTGKINYVYLNNQKLMLRYFTDYEKKVVTFQVDIPPSYQKFNWFALGFTDRGKLKRSDYCVYMKDEGGDRLKVVISDEFGQLVFNNMNFCTDPHTIQGHFIQFSRMFDACTNRNYIITSGTVNMVWFHGFDNPRPGDHGIVNLKLLKNPDSPAMPDDTQKLKILADKHDVLMNGTNNYCILDAFPDWLIKKKHHLIRYTAEITIGNDDAVNQMELFHCHIVGNKTDRYEGLCSGLDASINCDVPISWANGDSPFNYPPDVGLPFGGSDNMTYFKLVIQYINTKKIPVDSSGLTLYLTPELRKYDAQFMEIGMVDSDTMVIPPGLSEFDLQGLCTEDCTKKGLPKDGIYVFGSRFYTHKLGMKVVTRHFRDGKELPPLDYDYQYNSTYQPLSKLLTPVHVLPGDSLITHCIYSSKDVTVATFGGSNPQDESCVNIIQYYPATNFQNCKSSIGTTALKDFFQYIHGDGITGVSPSNTARKNFELITPWSQTRLTTLKALYSINPVNVQCQQIDGVQFPGNWDNVNRDNIRTPLPMPERHCPNSSLVKN